MAAKTRAHFPLKPECASKTEPTIESCLRRRRKPGARCAPGGRAHDHRGRPCLHRGREWSAWLERACPYCLSAASPRPQTPGRRRSRGSLSAAQMGIFPTCAAQKGDKICEDPTSPESFQTSLSGRLFVQSPRSVSFSRPRKCSRTARRPKSGIRASLLRSISLVRANSTLFWSPP